ncbi:MAG: archaemetzincin family Zn-dependent metalloprotease [candidate division WOR-3 bacterium]
MKRIIYLLPMGEIEQIILKEIEQKVKLAFNLDTCLLTPIPNPEYAYEHRREQYFSSRILEQLTKLIPNDGLKILGVTDVDLATPVLTFVFGEAQLNGCAAVISIKRLRQEFYSLLANQQILLERASKEAIHELGHTFGLLHCDEKECVMHFSANITGIDRKELNFCSSCLSVLIQNCKDLND